MRTLKVGELARRAGVSVRALHYYEEIGLLEPVRTESGHRRYGRAAIARLQQVRSLQQLGLSLAEIQGVFGRRGPAPARIVAGHLARVRGQRDALARLERRLEHLLGLLEAGERIDDAGAVDALLNTLEAMMIYEKHLTPEQLEQVNARHEAAGDAGARWQAALDDLRAEMTGGTSAADPKVKAIAERWHDAAAAFMPEGDEATHEAVIKLLHDEPQARQDHGLDDELFAYLGRALAPDDHGG